MSAEAARASQCRRLKELVVAEQERLGVEADGGSVAAAGAGDTLRG